MAINKDFKVKNGIDVAGNATIGGSITVTGAIGGRDIAADGTKLDTIETSATADQTNLEIKTAYEANADTNAFLDAEKSKLTGIETSATADQTKADIDALGIAATSVTGSQASAITANTAKVSNVDHPLVETAVPVGALFTDTDTVYTHPTNHAISVITGLQSALDDKVDDSQVLTNVPSGAVFTDTNTTYTVGDGGLTTNDFTNADHSKLNAIEASATADQTKADIEGLGIDVPATNLTGTIAAARLSTATTQVESDDSTKIATTAYVVDKITTLIGGAPSTLNDLNELAAAINDDAAYNSTLTTALGTKLPKAGGTMTGNLSFGDNNQSIYGTGADLRVYHSGVHSFVSNTTGNMYIQDNNYVEIGSSSGEVYIGAVKDGAVNLRYDNVTKLATTSTGVNVTGTVTADGLVVDGAGTTVLSGGQYIRVDGNAAGTTDLEPVIWARSKVGASIPQINVKGAHWQFGGGGTLDANPAMDINYATGDISFYEDTGTTAKFFWDASAESLGIGTSSPSLTGFGSGTIGIDIDQPINAAIRIDGNAADSLYLVSGSGKHWILGKGAVPITFSTNSSERLRIDSSGNVLVGTTSAYGTTGTTINAAGLVYSSADGDRAGQFDRTTSDGELVRFSKAGTTVGSIANQGGDILINAAGTGRLGSGGVEYFKWDNNQFYPAVDNARSLGYSGSKWKDLHLSGTANVGSLVSSQNATALAAGYVSKLWTAYASESLRLEHNGHKVITTEGYNLPTTLKFHTYIGGASSEKMRIDSLGNVGIGTSTPDAKLDIEGNFESSYALKFTNTMGTGKVSGFRSHGGNGEALSLYHDNHRRQMWDSSGSTTFESTSGSTQMTISSAGNVTATSFVGDGSNLTGIDAATVSTTAPSSPAAGDMWFDSTSSITAMKVWNGAQWDQMSNKFTATGGTVSSYTSGGIFYKVHTFTSSGTFTAETAGTIDVVRIAGGGSGGGSGGTDGAGGGGAGGMLESLNVGITAASYSVVIGAGGAGSNAATNGNSGTNTSFSGLTTCIGGGFGSAEASNRVAGNGGSGGGAGGHSGTPGSGTTGQGYGGGTCSGPGDGGGGGAGGAGGNGPSGTGGIGRATSLKTGSAVMYAGGGGASGDPRVNSGAAGTASSGGGAGQSTNSAGPVSGTTNSGGGGGGSAGLSYGGIQPSGNGGSGIVIIRYVG